MSGRVMLGCTSSGGRDTLSLPLFHLETRVHESD